MKITNVQEIYDNGEFVTLILNNGHVVHLPDHKLKGRGHTLILLDTTTVEVDFYGGDKTNE